MPPDYPNTMVIGDIKFLWYDLCDSNRLQSSDHCLWINETLRTREGGKYEYIMGQMGQNSQKWCIMGQNSQKWCLVGRMHCQNWKKKVIYLKHLGATLPIGAVWVTNAGNQQMIFHLSYDRICSYFFEHRVKTGLRRTRVNILSIGYIPWWICGCVVQTGVILAPQMLPMTPFYF